MEFVRVTFSSTRPVNVDGAPRGQTGQLLRVQAGTHNFDLGSPLNYTPSSVMTPVRGTAMEAPMVIAFVPLVAAMRRRATARAAASAPEGTTTKKKKTAVRTPRSRRRVREKTSTGTPRKHTSRKTTLTARKEGGRRKARSRD